MDCKVIQGVKNIKAYKVIGGGDDATLRVYNEALSAGHDPRVMPSDWKALYTQFLAEHTIGTIPYRWERGCQEAVLVEATIHTPLDVVLMDGPSLHDGSLSGEEKAEAIKQLLKLDPAVLLMEGLGQQNIAALVRETENEWELIISHDLVNRLSFDERKVARFTKHPKFPVTAKWCKEGEPWVP